MRDSRNAMADLRVLEGMEPAVTIFDLDGRVLYFNPSSERVMGVRPAELLGRVLWEAFPEAQGGLFHQVCLRVARTGQEERFDHFYPPFNRWFHNHLFRMDDRVYNIAIDITERKRAADQARILARAGESMAGTLEEREVLQRLVEAVVPDICDVAAIDLIGEDGWFVREAVAVRDPAHKEIAYESVRHWPVPVNSDQGLARVVRTGEPLLVAEVPPALLEQLARDPEHLALLRASDMRSLLILPIEARGRPLGTLSLLQQSAGGRRFDADDVDFGRALARRAGLALDNARLFQETSTARAHASQLQVVTAALARAETVEEVASVIVDQGLHGLNAQSAIVARLRDGRIHSLRERGWIRPVSSPLRGVRLEKIPPAAEAVQGREALFFDSIKAMETEFPQVGEAARSAGGEGAQALLPLIAGEAVIGLLWLGWSQPHRFAPAERRLGVALARQCAEALARAELLEALRLSEDRVRRVYAMTMSLGGLLQVDEVARTFLLEGLEHLGATRALVGLVEGESYRIIAETGYPEGFLDPWSLAPLTSAPAVVEALSRRQTCTWKSVDDLVQAFPDVASATRDAGPGARGILPLLAGDRPIGFVTLNWAAPRSFTPDEIAFLDALARTCAQAMERARLYSAAERERARAEEASRLKDEFLATLSHELRTPLSAITGWTQLLRRGRVPEAGLDRALEVVERNGLALSRLISDLLDVSRVISGKLRLESVPVDLVQVVTAAVDTTRPAAEAKGISLLAELDPDVGTLTGDPDRLQQVAWNLLSNALKFTPDGGFIGVRLRRLDGEAELSIEDSGQGIDLEFLPHLFERFRQADGGASRRHGGLGLGLAIARHLVELHGGRIEARSDGPGRGSVFIVRLPVEGDRVAPGSKDSPASPTGPRSLSGLEVLVIDDEADARTLLQAALGLQGARVQVAASAEEGFQALQSARPQVLVSDIGMPGEDGYSLIRRLRALPEAEGGRIPAIALTAFASEADRARALEAGFDLHLAKPVDLDLLAAEIARLVSD